MGSAAESRTAWSRRARLACVGVACVGLLYNAAHYFPFQVDDTFITLQYVRRLLDGHGLTWTDGLRPAAGYTSMLHVLILAALGAAGLELETASRVVGVIGAGMGVAAPLLVWRRALPVAWAAGVVAASGGVAVWAVAGLEETLFMGVFALGLAAAMAGRIGLAGLLLTPLPWIRPDAPLLVASLGGGLLLAGGLRREAWRDTLRLGAGPFLAWLALGGVLMALYGEPFPNTAHAKLVEDPRVASRGLDYLLLGLWFGLRPALLPALLVAGAALLPWGRSLRGDPLPAWARRALLVCAPLLVWCAYVVYIGGDFMQARRHLVPVHLMLAFLGAEAFARLPRAGWALALPLLGAQAWVQRGDVANRMAYAQRDGSERAAAGRLLGEVFGAAQPRVAVEAAGALPYYSQLPALDMLGLNDWDIAHAPVLAPGAASGHGLGDPDYVLAQAPDLVVFCGLPSSGNPCWPAGIALTQRPGWADYQHVLLRWSGKPLPIWVRRDSARVGRRWLDSDTLEVPAWLFGGEVFVEEGGVLALQVGEQPARATLTLPPGRWEVDGARFVDDALAEDGLRLTEPQPVELVIAPGVVRRAPVRVTRLP